MKEYDTNSKNYWIERLTYKGWEVTDTANTIGQFASWDLEINKPNSTDKILVELKDRNMTSTAYGDNMIQNDKYEAITKEMKNNSNVTRALVISMFTDDVIFINDVTDANKPFEKWCWSTTISTEAAHRYVKKEFRSYEPKVITSKNYK